MSDQSDTAGPGAQETSRPLLAPVRSVLAPAFLFSCVINVLVSTSPVFMMQTMDRVLPSSNLSTLAFLTGLAVAALAVMSVLEYLRGIMMARTAAWWESETLNRLLPRASRSDVAVADTAGDVSKVSGFLGGPSLAALFDAPWVVLFFALLYLLHPLLAALGAVVAAILLAIALVGHLMGREAQRRALECRAQAAGVASRLDRNADLLGTMGMSGNLLRLHRSLHERAQVLALKVGEPDKLRRMLAKLVRSVTQILTLALGAWLVLQGELTGGSMIASSIILARALSPIEQITGILTGLVETRLALARLQMLEDSTEAETDQLDLPEPEGHVVCEAITIPTTAGRPPRLNQISLQLRPGEALTIMGSSGSGKSTLASLMAGATYPTIGSVKVDGFDLRHWSAEQRARIVGYLPQTPTLFPGTIAENIARFKPNAEEAEIVRAATAAGVHGMISRLVDGYQTRIDFETGPLSGGERQRIALARAIFESPRVLILDEPNASLDKEGERALMSTLGYMKKAGTTIVMVAHRAGVLGVADKVLLLEAGRIRDFGPKVDVINRMNARMLQIELERHATEIPRLEDWVNGHFKRDGDADAKSSAAMVAIEMFNLSLNAPGASGEVKPILFTLKHRVGVCTITMFDTCEMIAASRIDMIKRMARDPIADIPPLEQEDMALLMLMQLSMTFDQKRSQQGRALIAEIETPVQEREIEDPDAPTHTEAPTQLVN